MIVNGVDQNTTEAEIRQAFEYSTHFPIPDIRLVKDKFGKPRGFCFVQWKSVEDCAAVMVYLRAAALSFHIADKHVKLEYSTPQGSLTLFIQYVHRSVKYVICVYEANMYWWVC